MINGWYLCTLVCPEGTLKCASENFCYISSQRCDRITNCPDETDEANCSKGKSRYSFNIYALENHCLAWKMIMEINAYFFLYLVACTENEFSCQNGRCIPQSAACDKKVDCLDKSDEGTVCGKLF